MEATKSVRRVSASLALGAEEISELRSSVRGAVLHPGNEGYDQARAVWNASIDRRPALIVRCMGVADVQTAVNFARERNMLLSIRGGGHNIAGAAVCDDGLMIDLSLMNFVRIDPANRVAHVGPGATLGDFDHEAQAFGLATPLGINSTTGVSGLTLGGGFGWLSRKYGMTVDNLIAADVVKSDGQFMCANETENSDLFWALRGGSGNFGVVTRFEFKLHPVGPSVFCGLVAYSLDEAPEILKKYREFARTMSDDISAWMVLRQAPPLPFLPAQHHGKGMLGVAAFYAGDPSRGRAALEPLRRFGKILGEHFDSVPYTSWQRTFDGLLVPGARNYWKSHNLTEIKDELIEITTKYARSLPDQQCEIFFGQIGGATERVSPTAMAYSHRQTKWAMNVHTRWERPSDDEKCISWARSFFNDSKPFAAEGVYVNFLTKEESDRVKDAYGQNYDRLALTKRKYDPNNLFRMNQNVQPA